MANNKTITIEHIIAKLDNDFNPDGSDWIPRVPAWCVDAMNELKVLRKVDKKMKLTVINKIAKSKCCLIDDGLKVYDSNGCEVPRADGSKYRCSDTESAPSSTGGLRDKFAVGGNRINRRGRTWEYDEQIGAYVPITNRTINRR